MTDLFHAADRADHHAARLLLPHLAADGAISRRLINDIMNTAFGGSDGRWTQRTSFEVLEHALALHLRSSGQGLNSLLKSAAWSHFRAAPDPDGAERGATRLAAIFNASRHRRRRGPAYGRPAR